MARVKKVVEVEESDPLAGVARKDLPALLAKAKAEGDQALVDAILAACSQ